VQGILETLTMEQTRSILLTLKLLHTPIAYTYEKDRAERVESKLNLVYLLQKPGVS
jgi:hypothetical protein